MEKETVNGSKKLDAKVRLNGYKVGHDKFMQKAVDECVKKTEMAPVIIRSST